MLMRDAVVFLERKGFPRTQATAMVAVFMDRDDGEVFVRQDRHDRHYDYCSSHEGKDPNDPEARLMFADIELSNGFAALGSRFHPAGDDLGEAVRHAARYRWPVYEKIKVTRHFADCMQRAEKLHADL